MVNIITAALVKQLRERTGAGMMECKKVLIESQGNIELAIDNMRKLGQTKAAKKAGRITGEGVILIKISQNNKYGVIVEVNCETDFVTKDILFKEFVNEVINVSLKNRINDIQKLKKQFEELRIELVSKIGENINIRRLAILEGDNLGYYLHGSRIGVIVSSNVGADDTFLKHLAMHIAASKPEYLNTDNIPDEVIAREYQIQLDIAMRSAKSQAIAEKIVEGRMRKFTDAISLNNQNFLMDPSKTVSQQLRECKVKINNFIRFEVGEGINKN